MEQKNNDVLLFVCSMYALYAIRHRKDEEIVYIMS